MHGIRFRQGLTRYDCPMSKRKCSLAAVSEDLTRPCFSFQICAKTISVGHQFHGEKGMSKPTLLNDPPLTIYVTTLLGRSLCTQLVNWCEYTGFKNSRSKKEVLMQLVLCRYYRQERLRVCFGLARGFQKRALRKLHGPLNLILSINKRVICNFCRYEIRDID